jgi:hypothetical protein
MIKRQPRSKNLNQSSVFVGYFGTLVCSIRKKQMFEGMWKAIQSPTFHVKDSTIAGSPTLAI